MIRQTLGPILVVIATQYGASITAVREDPITMADCNADGYVNSGSAGIRVRSDNRMRLCLATFTQLHSLGIAIRHAAVADLVLLKGDEVERDRLQQAIDHRKAIEEDAVDGLSFSNGMQLPAGPRDRK